MVSMKMRAGAVPATDTPPRIVWMTYGLSVVPADLKNVSP
jgi:hypothetical protein